MRSSVVRGALGFCVPSLAVFGSWALAGKWMYRNLTEVGAYAVWALLFIGLSGIVLHRLLVKDRPLPWFQGVFTAAFLLYAVGWCAAWFALRNKAGEWVGSLTGTAAMAWVFARAFRPKQKLAPILTGLFAAHSAGYFIGGILFAAMGGGMGKILWGVCYGLGFGAGIGWALHLCQRPAQPA